MACFTPEQLSALALGLDDGEFAPHLSACPACRAKLDDVRRLSQELAAVHAKLDRNHATSRAQLLSRLSHIERPSRSVATWRRFAFGGLGLTSAAALLLLAFFATSSSQLSAMERMLTAVREVTSYSFKGIENTTYLDPAGKPKAVRRGTFYFCWRAPDKANRQWLGDLHSEVKAWRRTVSEDENVSPDDSAAKNENPTFHIVETCPTGKPSLVVFYTEGHYFWAPPARADDMPVDNVIAQLRAVQQGQGKIVREFGSKRIDSREAHGYVVDFEDAIPFKGYGPVEVWIDPQTDLPMELSYKWNQDLDKIIDESRITDIRWNIDIPSNQFATIPSADLVNATPPTVEKDIAEIIAALKLYAELSGGHYPRVRTLDPYQRRDPEVKYDPPDLFDGQNVRDEMLRLAGFTGPSQSEWTRDPKYQQIESATPGLDWLTRILLNRYHAGFFGAEVGPRDKDKVLLWWAIDVNDSYRVFYGDLRTEVVPAAKWAELVPTAAEP